MPTHRSAETAAAIVLFGATGDLATRMLWPALYALSRDALLPPGLRVIGAARSEHSAEELRSHVAAAVNGQHPAGAADDEALASFLARLDYVRVDAGEEGDFARVRERLGDAAEGALHYLATSPSIYGPLCAGLAASGLADVARGVVLEKPIGRDLASSHAINDAVAAVFDESRVFRVDHYLGKETVQNLLALRFGNILLEPLWNSHAIEHVQITIAETVGVEGRSSYYDETGALRDMVQNHLLQLVSLLAMEPPADFEPNSVRNEKIKVLKSLRPIEGEGLARHAVAGQYAPGVADGAAVPGYQDEVGAVASRTETFVALLAHVDNWRWAGVPFFLRTGKRLAERRTEIILRFRPLPHDIFGPASGAQQNILRIRLQPEETVELTVMSKEPGLEGMRLKPVTLDLSMTEAFPTYRRRIAYERLILDALHGETTLFVRRDEVEAAWTWIDRISAGWAAADAPPKPYPAGSWGPSASVGLIERAGFSWLE